MTNTKNIGKEPPCIEEKEQIAIQRLQKFARIAKAMEFDICVGYSGGKDSEVVLDLCKRAGIEFKAYFNHCFESATTLKFIREAHPEVVWRREVKEGFVQNVSENHGGMLPTVFRAYCCEDYKHNPKSVDKCSVVGVRRAESRARSMRTAFSAKNKTTLKKNKDLINEHFIENCQSVGTASVIQLLPIVDWSDAEVWAYMRKHLLPVNPEYEDHNRVGCLVCPKQNFSRNGLALLKYPRLIDAFINARIKGFDKRKTNDINWVITCDGRDYIDDKPYYICRWLNHSFAPFTKKQKELYDRVRRGYDELHKTQKL